MMLRAHAKVNLLLHVRRKREDGFHELHTVYQPLALHDLVQVAPTEGRPGIHLASDHSQVPLDERNTAHKAARLLAEHGKVDLQKNGVFIHIRKSIPLAGGVGGSAADAAPVLEALNHYWKLRLPRKQLHELGAKVGSDVPQALLKRLSEGTGRGERVTPYRKKLPRMRVVLVDALGDRYFGGAKDKTARLYQALSPRLAGLKVARKSSLAKVRAAIRSGKWERVEPLLENDFERVAFERHPELREVKQALRESGARAALLAGAGPVVFGLVGPEFDPGLVAMEARRRFPKARVWVTSTI